MDKEQLIQMLMSQSAPQNQPPIDPRYAQLMTQGSAGIDPAFLNSIPSQEPAPAPLTHEQLLMAMGVDPSKLSYDPSTTQPVNAQGGAVPTGATLNDMVTRGRFDANGNPVRQ